MSSMSKFALDKVKGKEAEIKQAFEKLCKNDSFQRTLSGGIQNKASILRRRELWSKLVKPILES